MECGRTMESKYEVDCIAGVCQVDTWPTYEDNTGQDITTKQNISWEYTDCVDVSIEYLNKTVGCGKAGWRTGTVTKMVGLGVFTTELEPEYCYDCDHQLFQWTTWSWAVNGTKKIRTRGSTSILDSFQQEEKQGVTFHFNFQFSFVDYCLIRMA